MRAESGLDEEHLAAALRYVSLNPVRAHLGGGRDGVTTPAPVRERYPDFTNFLSEEADDEAMARLRRDDRPSDRQFLNMLQRKTKRFLKPAKRGLKARAGEES